MIRIIVQRRKQSRHSFIERMRCLHNVFDINWFKAIKLAYQIHKGYGIVISTPLSSDGPNMIDYMNSIHNRLHIYFDTNYKLISNRLPIIPLDKYKLCIISGGYRAHIALKKGYIDYNLEIY